MLDQKSLRWIFVGGKGGVGKTTNSCCLAIQLARCRESVLLISTDPAHNLSDAFAQKFTKDPTLVKGFSNLYAMEIDPTASIDDSLLQGTASDNPLSGLMQEFTSAIPGIDEAMGFAQVMKLVNGMEYSVIVFDTAPTGHTLRFLGFPAVLERALEKFSEMSGRFAPLLSQFGTMFGLGGGASSTEGITSRLSEMKKTVEEVNRQFQDSEKTTFICVLIAEFLSLYETERMIQELTKFNIDTHNLVVNQLIFPTADSKCGICVSRKKMQQKYLEQIDELYSEDFHIVRLPLLPREVRGVSDLTAFSELQVKKESDE